MRHIKIILFAVCSFVLISSSLSASDTKRTNFEKARTKAVEEGKLLFIGFHAKWCGPCKWMDETTFADDKVKSTLTNDFVSIKVDIDDFEGFELKSKYDIRFLPTLIVIDKNGKVVVRIEETLAPTKLLSILENTKEKGPSTFIHKANTSPKSNSVDNFKSFTRANGKMHRLQMGLYSNFEGAITKVNELNQVFIEPIVIVMDDEESENKKYRVIMGEFNSLNEAVSYKEIIKDKFKLDSIVY